MTYTAIHVQDLGEIVWIPVEEILWRFSREEFFAVIKDFFDGFCSHQFSKPKKCIIIIFVTFSNAVKHKACSAIESFWMKCLNFDYSKESGFSIKFMAYFKEVPIFLFIEYYIYHS